MNVSNKGFTLIELMITVAMMSLVLSIGLPSFQSIIDQTRLTSTANAMLGAYQMAKFEAIKRHQTVDVSSDDDWKSWVVKYTETINGNTATQTIIFEGSKSVTVTKLGGVTGFEANGRPDNGGSCGLGTSTPPECGFTFEGKSGSKKYFGIGNTGRMKVHDWIEQPQKLSDNELLAMIYTLFAEMENKAKLLDQLKQEAERRKLI